MSRKTEHMLMTRSTGLVRAAWLGLFIAGAAFGQSATVGPIAGYTATNFTYESLYTGTTLTNGGLVHVSATFTKPVGMELFGLKAVPALPAGWSVDWDPSFQVGLYDYNLPSNAGSVPGSPFVTAAPIWVPVSGKFLYGPGNLGLTVAADIKLNFALYVSPGDTGDKELSIVWQYALSDGIDVDLPCSDNPAPITDLNAPMQPARSGTLVFGR